MGNLFLCTYKRRLNYRYAVHWIPLFSPLFHTLPPRLPMQSSKTVFSAGLDILEMYKPVPENLKRFWTNLQDVWLKLYGSSFPTAAAINVSANGAISFDSMIHSVRPGAYIAS